MRRGQGIFNAVAVFYPYHLPTHDLPTPRLFPQFAVCHLGHQKLKRAGSVHLLAYYRHDLAQNAIAKRKIDVHSRGLFTDKSGAQHKLVARHDGISRIFFKRRDYVT